MGKNSTPFKRNVELANAKSESSFLPIQAGDQAIANKPLQKQGKNSEKTKLAVIPLMCLIMVFFGSVILIVLLFEQFFDAESAHRFNGFCSQLDQSIDKESLDYQICHHSEKKKNFVWMHLDGFAFDQLKQFTQAMKDEALIFKSIGPSYRQSGAMHESHFTGMPSRNFIGNPIKLDNIAKQIHESTDQIRMEFTGTPYPLETLVGEYMDAKKVYRHEDGFFRGMCEGENEMSSRYFKWVDKFEDESIDMNKLGVHIDRVEFENLLEKTYPRWETSDMVFDFNMKLCLTTGGHVTEDFATVNKSTVYFTTFTDSLNHAYSKAHAYNVFSYFRFNKFLIQLLRFYGKYLPNTAVFLSSDHGGQYFNGEDNFCNHGCANEDNQGMFIAYLPGRHGKGRVDRLSYMDIAPTIAQFLEGVNIPISSKGIPAPLEKGVFKWEVIALHSRYVQLKSFLDTYATKKSLKEHDIYADVTCATLSKKHANVLTEDAAEKLSSAAQQDILSEYKKCIAGMSERMEQAEIALKDHTVVWGLEAILILTIIFVFLRNKSKLAHQISSYSLVNKIVLIAAIAIMFSDNITLIFMDQDDLPFYQASFFVYLALLLILIYIVIFMVFSSDESLDSLKQAVSSNTYQRVPDEALNSSRLSSVIEEEQSSQQSQYEPAGAIIRTWRSRFTIDSCVSLRGCLLFFVLLLAASEYMFEHDTFVKTKQDFMESVMRNNRLTYFNYFVFICFYFLPRMKSLQMYWLQRLFYCALFYIMIDYDLIDLRYLIMKSESEVYTTRLTTISIAIAYLFNIARAYRLVLVQRKQEQKLDSDSYLELENEKKKEDSFDISKQYFSLVQIDVAIFVFYIGDDIERFFLILIYLPMVFVAKKMLEILKQLHEKQENKAEDKSHMKDKLNLAVGQVLVLAIMFKSMQSIYMAFKGTLSLDINLQSGNKTIGEYQDQIPEYTGFLFGMNKVIVYMLGFIDVSSMFLTINLKSKVLKLDQSSLYLIALIFMKSLVSALQVLFNMFGGDKFFGLFMWAVVTAVFSIQLLPYALIRGVDSIRHVLCGSGSNSKHHHEKDQKEEESQIEV